MLVINVVDKVVGAFAVVAVNVVLVLAVVNIFAAFL